MKKYMITGMAALAMGCTFTACTHDTGFDENAIRSQVIDTYEKAFVNAFGQPAAEQDWGFGVRSYKNMTGTRTRSQSSPACPDISQPYDGTWVTNYLATATEPTTANVADNYDNGTWERTGEDNNIDWQDPQQVADRNYFWNNLSWPYTESDLAWINANHPNWIRWKADPDFVTNFKITGTWDGDINVAGSEGSSSPGAERTIVVTGTWNITANQRIGSLGKIIIANGGTVNVANGITLNMVNEARLVVLPGGHLTGGGKVEVNNGNSAGLENYNAGTIDVAVFNNNFGKFYNYGQFLVTEYQGGAKESNFYNHSLVHIKHTGLGSETPNARIFNACQWYCEGDMRCRNYEGIMGSSFIVGGQLMVSGSEDGTTTPSYFGLAAGALVKCGSLYNNGTSWTGPTSGGFAALEIVSQIDFLNWEQDAPETGGYFENNIYVKCSTWDNVPDGNGMQQKTDNGTEYYTMSKADYKFWSIIANCRGNKGVTKVKDGSKELLPADSDFNLGSTGCTPGFYAEEDDDNTDDGGNNNPSADIRVIAEDLSITDVDDEGRAAKSDLDFNDVVFDVEWISGGAKITLQAAGGTLPLVVGVVPNPNNEASWTDYEVHGRFGVAVNTIVNTNHRLSISKPAVDFTLSGDFGEDASKIPVYVRKGGQWYELTAAKGQPASKIGVAPSFQWVEERRGISEKYPNFSSWVQNGSPLVWW